MAETSGLLNRRRGYSPTEGSNPSVSAIIEDIGQLARMVRDPMELRG